MAQFAPETLAQYFRKTWHNQLRIIQREANTAEVTELRKEAEGLKLLVAEQALELRVIKKSLRGLE